MFALFDTLKTDEPTTVSDASALMLATGAISSDDAMPRLIVPLVYYELSGEVVDMARDVYDVGRDTPTVRSTRTSS